jgi:hypothetical protein
MVADRTSEQRYGQSPLHEFNTFNTHSADLDELEIFFLSIFNHSELISSIVRLQARFLLEAKPRS